MKYKYYGVSPLNTQHKTIKRPMVMVEIFGNKRTKKMLALVDSGADVSMLNLGVAKMLDIDLSKAERGTTIGITGVQETYIATIEIKVEGQVEKRKIPVRFIDSEYVDMLLGQEGFFDAYRIKFEKDHDTFEITLSRKK
jgi:hypothetical protein